jgi:hypothetical protein
MLEPVISRQHFFEFLILKVLGCASGADDTRLTSAKGSTNGRQNRGTPDRDNQ